MSPSFKSKVKHYIKQIGIYSAILVAIGGWIYVVADNYYGNKYKNIDIAKQVVDLQDTSKMTAAELKNTNEKIAAELKNANEIIAAKLKAENDKDTTSHIDIVKELQKYSDGNFKNNREVINQLVESSKKNNSDHTVITNKLSSLETTATDSNQRIIRIENILMNKKAIEGELGWNSK